MGPNVSRATLAAFALSLVWLAPPARSECMYTVSANPFCYSYPSPTAPTRWQCIKNLTMDETCGTTDSVVYGGNVTMCYYIPGQDRLVAAQPLIGMGPGYCQMTCDCGTFKIDHTQGLPVELMDFEVENGAEDQESDATEDSESD